MKHTQCKNMIQI